MYIKQDMDFNDLMNNCWSGAIDTLRTIEEHDKEDELMAHLEEQWFDEAPTMTEINDYLWFDDEFIFECLGISEDEEEEEGIDYEEGETEQETVDFNQFCGMFECEKCPYDEHCKTREDCYYRYIDLKFPEEEEDEE